MKNSGLIFSNTTVNIDNEVNIIETNSNKKYKKKHAARSCRHNKVILADINIYHKPCLHIHQHFRSISSSTINFQLTQISLHTTLQINIIIHNQLANINKEKTD